MRDIKFRAWDKVNKRWIKQFNIDLLSINVSELPNIELMQYTGLKDINKKEIYEGDIVEAWSEGEKAIGKVKQRIDGLWLMYPAWQSGKIWGLMPNKERKTTVKIIGNIYENKELLRGEA